MAQQRGFWARLFGWAKENPIASLILQHKNGQPQWAPRNYAGFAREGYMLNPYVFRAIDLRAKAIGGLRWIAVRRKADGELEELDGHPLAALLRRPQPRKGGSRFFGEIESQLCISGNSFVVGPGPISGENAGKPRELWTLRPDLVQILPGTGVLSPVGGYRYEVNGSRKDFKAAEVMHLSFYHPLEDFWGLSPLEPGGRSVDHNNAARSWNASALQNGAKPEGAFVAEGNLTPDQRTEITRQYREERAGPSNAGIPMFLEGGLKWVPQGFSPRDMDWLEGMKLSSRETVNVLGVPPEMVGDTANKTFNSYPEARKAFYQDTVLPEADYLRDELNAYLAAFGAEVEYDRDAIEALREDREKLWSYLGSAWQDGRITKNESRVGMGYDEHPEGDAFIDDGMGEVPEELPGGEGEDPDADPEVEDAEEDEAEAAPEGAEEKALWSSPGFRRYKSIDKRRAKWIKAIRASALKRLTLQRARIKSAVATARGPVEAIAEAEQIILAERAEWAKFYRSLYQAVGSDFGKATRSRLKMQAGPRATKADNDTDRLVEQLVDAWLRRHAGTKIQGILDTDLERVRNELADGVKLGEGVDELAKRIDAYLEPLYAKRSQSIARTEVIPASNLGSQMAARATGLPIRKSWLSTPGARTRPTHSSANGQSVALDQPYVVGGQKLLFPGDHSLGASADNTVQCRCSETYDVEEAA